VIFRRARILSSWEKVKKILDEPEFRSEMKEIHNTKDFKNSIKKTEEIMKDPCKKAAWGITIIPQDLSKSK
jgi:protein associated with RNAse G/E